MTTSIPIRSPFSTILDALTAALQATSLFETVSLGDDPGSLHRFPACTLVPHGRKTQRISAGMEMGSYAVRLHLAVRSVDTMAAVKQLHDLWAAVESALDGQIFAGVTGHFDTVVGGVLTGSGKGHASTVRTLELSVEISTAQEA